MIYNIFANLFVQIIIALSGFVIPKFIIVSYGSTINGMVSSISQFLTYAALVEMGVGNASIVALYKPIAERNNVEINAVLKQSKRKYLISGMVYTVIAGLITMLYPLAVKEQVRYEAAFYMALILSMNGLIDYFIIGKYKVLLIADEKMYVINIIKGISTIILTASSIFLLIQGSSIYLVKLLAVLMHLLEAVFIKYYVLKKYRFVTFDAEKEVRLEQQSSALFHQICAVIVYNTDLIILTLFLNSETSLMEISVYSVYNMVRNMIVYLGKVLTDGINATFGLMFATGDYSGIRKLFRKYEFIFFIYIFILYSCMLGLILSFVNCYTRNISDVNYLRVELALLFSLEGLLAQLKCLCDVIVIAAGHYRQSRKFVGGEAVSNLVLSILFVRPLGIVGVLMGTIISHVIVDICFMCYVAKELVPGTGHMTIKRVIRNMIVLGILWWIEIYKIPLVSDWGQWIVEVIAVGMLNATVFILINFGAEREMVRQTFKSLWGKVKNRRKKEEA